MMQLFYITSVFLALNFSLPLDIIGKWELIELEDKVKSVKETFPVFILEFKANGNYIISFDGKEDMGRYKFVNDSLYTTILRDGHANYKIEILDDMLYMRGENVNYTLKKIKS